MARDPKMLEQFRDPAVPDGASTMSDDWMETHGTLPDGGSHDKAVPAHSSWGHCDECGWNGPAHVGVDARKAREDAHNHNNEHVGHAAYVKGSGGHPG